MASPLVALADHPLLTEDTGVLGSGTWQLELHGERARERSAGATSRESEVSAVLGYGMTDRADLQLELPYQRQRIDDDATGRSVASGRGDASLALKWRFLERDKVSMVLKPQVMLPTGRDDLALGAGRMRWALSWAGAYELGAFELIAHVAYVRNRNRIGERGSIRQASGAALYSVTDKLRLLADLGWETNPDPAERTRVREIVYGATYALADNLDVGIGYKRGLSGPADDRAVRAGLKLRWK